MSWPIFKLGDLVTIKGGGTPSKKVEEYWNGDIPWASVKDLKGNEISSTADFITEAGVKNSATNLIPAGTILTATRMALGRFVVTSADMAINQDLKALFINDSSVVERNYLIKFLSSKAKYIEGEGKGATVKGITLDFLKDLQIPLPPLEEQKRIAAILDKADSVRRKRQQAIDLADDFLRSVFLDMFGDPVINPKGWEVKKVKNFAKVTTGNTPSRKESKYYGEDIEWIKSDNINTPEHILTTATEFLSLEGEKLARTVEKGSTLITCIAGSFDCIGNVAFADRKVSFNQQINALTPKRELVSDWFLYSLILFSKKLIQNASTNSMKGMVSKGKLEEVELILPPLEKQKEFEMIFNKQIKLKQKMSQSYLGSSDKFNSLSQKAFAGEL